MSQADEIQNLLRAAGLPASAQQQLQQIVAADPQGPARQANDPAISMGYLFQATNGYPLGGSPADGAVTVAPGGAGNAFVRLDLPGVTYLICVSQQPGSNLFLCGDTENGPVILAPSIQDPYSGTRWVMVGADIAGAMLVKSLGSGPGNLRYLSMTSVGKAGMVANPAAPLLGEVFTAWKWGKNPPPPPPPSAAQVSVEYFIWGMHFVIPEPQLKIWENDLTTVHDVLEAAAPLAGDIPVVGEILEAVIDAAAAYIQEEVSLMKQADKGNGVYLSMCWFAIGLFFPTPI